MLMTVYIVCAVFGGTILCLQFLLTCFGVGLGAEADVDVDTDFDVDSDFGAGTDADTDVDADSAHIHHAHGAAALFKVISFRTIIAGLTFFGLGGLLGSSGGASTPISLGIACLLGAVGILGVYYLYKSFLKFQHSGNLSATTLQWANGSVYLKIPAEGAGRGKVQVNHQERTMEYEAVTPGPELPAGTPIVVTKVISEQLVEVRQAD